MSRESQSDNPEYTWVIDRDYTHESLSVESWGMPSTGDASDDAKQYVFADIVGPYNANSSSSNLARSTGARFWLYDDDDTLYFSGRYWATDESGPGSEWAFAPLDDFGTPDSGAVYIKYVNPVTGKREVL